MFCTVTAVLQIKNLHIHTITDSAANEGSKNRGGMIQLFPILNPLDNTLESGMSQMSGMLEKTENSTVVPSEAR